MPPLSKAFSLDQIPDLSGKVVIVTGGATGIGYQTATALLKHNAKVYVASRSKTKFEAMLLGLQGADEDQKQRLKFLPLDLSSMKACVEAARAFALIEERLDVVVANAALSIMPCTLTVDGYEVQFATNHLGHFAFISHLLPHIQKTSKVHGEARIVIVASHAHSMYKSDLATGIDFNDLTVSKENDMTQLSDIQPSLQRYARSKLANIQYARALQRRLETQGFNNIFVNCLNPGTIGSPTFGSDNSPHLPSWVKIISQGIVRITSISPEDGALTSLMLATDPKIASENIKGRYFDVGPLAGKFVYGYSYDAEEKLSEFARDDEMGERLFDWSEEALAKVMAGT